MEFNKRYNRNEFVIFLQNKFLPEDFIAENTTINSNRENKFITEVTKLGNCKSLDLVVYEARHTSTNDARVGLSKETFRFLANEWESRALVLFVPKDDDRTYRFSLITIDLEETEEGKLKKIYSNPRRYSYLLGEGIAYYTPNKYLNESGRVKDEKDLTDRFSVEVLTKAFYQELSDWYAWAVKEIRFPNKLHDTTDDTKYNHEAAIRLVTRLIFVWFLKQKNLIPEEFFDEKYISENLLNDFHPNLQCGIFGHKSLESRYYKAILQNLFFAMLNSPITKEGGSELSERRFFSGRGDHDNNRLMRYESMFMNPQLFINLANSKVPFLNGGLFDCLDDKKSENYIDAFSEREEVMKALRVPDYLFFGELGKTIDLSEWYGYRRIVSAQGILDILKRYSFTVEENTPFDQDVSLDPELLGKVFENLLASYNPETQKTARKQTGSFYTPRRIVQYMVDESLISHLNRVVGKELEPEYKKLISYTDEDIELNDEQKIKIMNAIYQCKVLDPACGSGAYPVGVLQQMVHIISQLDPTNEQWKQMLLDDAVNASRSAFLSNSKEEREDRLKDIESAFDENLNNPDYARKLFIIENCIYGVDIQPIAIQISKLRFFISLVVDQKVNNNPTRNFGIRPLPNLEAKFVAANSLIPLSKPDDNLGRTPEIIELENKLKEANHKIFSAKTVRTKRKWKERLIELREEMKTKLIENGFLTKSAAELMVSWDMFNQNISAQYFDADWMFGVKEGFDIVIGNPPYVSTKDVTTSVKKDFEKIYGFSDDLYNLFTFRAFSLCVENGTISYITPKTFWTTQTKRNMRDLMLSHKVRYIYDTANPFAEVMVDTCIWQFIKTPYDRVIDNEILFLDGHENLYSPIIFEPIRQSIYINTQNSVFFKPTELNLLIWELYGEKVKELYGKWWDKIKTSRDIEKNKIELDNYRKSLKPGDVTLLGCLTEGGQGLATANNGKYIAVRSSTKWAKNIRLSRPKKLEEVINKFRVYIPGLTNSMSVVEYLDSLSENEIANLFDNLKSKYGRDIFGQGYIYKIVNDEDVADVDTLTKDEKENGIDISKKYYVPYDKGDKDGNRWYLETPFVIAWSKENVQFLKTDPKARYQGYAFYFREGLCWTDINTTYLKCRKKQKSINDVKSMSIYALSEKVTEDFIITLINSTLISYYVDTFINNTQTFQINDARQIPVVIPDDFDLKLSTDILTRAIQYKKTKNNDLLEKLQSEVDSFIYQIYRV